jgi:hypothetical protein
MGASTPPTLIPIRNRACKNVANLFIGQRADRILRVHNDRNSIKADQIIIQRSAS